ncbi:hypothetical protein Tco_0604667, partial [Tanacetum coccineum]
SKTTAWNEFSSTMASAIICLATNQKFNFSKYIFKDEVVHKELGNSLVRAATTASSLEAEQDSGGGPRCQETIGHTIAQTRFENVSKLSNDSLLARGNTLQSDEDGLKLDELMELCTTLQSRVLDLEKTKTTQANEIASLKRRVKKLEKKRSSRTHKLERLYKVGLSARVQSSKDKESLEQEVAAKDVNLTINEVTLAQALAALKSVKPKVKEDVIEEPNVPVNAASASTKVSAATTTTATIPNLMKGIVITELGTPTITRSSQQPSHAEDDIQAKIVADHELAQRLQAKEQEELFVEEKAKLFQQLLEQRRKHFAAKSAEEKRNKPPTQAQQRKIMCTYLKNMEGKKLKDMKNKSFNYIQKMFDRAFKRVNTFVDFITDLVEGSSKRVGEELEQESIKKQKVDEDKDTSELQSLMEVIPDEEEVAIDVVPLATKPPTIVDWKIYKEGKNSYFQIIRADESSKMYLVFSKLLKSIDKEDLVEMYKLVKAKYGSTRPVEDMDLLLREI